MNRQPGGGAASGAGPRRGLHRFGACTLDGARGELTAGDGRRSVLRPKTLALLLLLLERAGEVVSRETILDTVWPGLVVTDDSITQCVVELRKALGTADAGMLHTLPRRGYQLQAGIGKYRVLSKLGDGATSEVFLARDDFADRDVAIKRLRPAPEPVGEGQVPEVSRHAGLFFAAEAALVGRLRHPNVVEILDAVDDGYVPGGCAAHPGGSGRCHDVGCSIGGRSDLTPRRRSHGCGPSIPRAGRRRGPGISQPRADGRFRPPRW